MVLFVLRKRPSCGDTEHYSYKSSGLFQSAEYVSDMLNDNHIPSTVVTVIDSNGIDKVVVENSATTVILEAIWCPPYKLIELSKLHPKVKWIVRIHSEIPFLANEGMALNWLHQYVKIPNVRIGANSDRAVKDIKNLHPLYLPNYYPLADNISRLKFPYSDLRVGCFGAVRPLKNQLIQAIAAIEYANIKGRRLIFYINSTRTEQGGAEVLKNLRALFNAYPQHELKEVPWMEPPVFLGLVSLMDVCMSVSLSETFNIVTADAVSQKVPVVVSPEVDWVSSLIQAKPNSVKDIVKCLDRALRFSIITSLNLKGLRSYDEESVDVWTDLFKHEKGK